jgi:hypothetical protein
MDRRSLHGLEIGVEVTGAPLEVLLPVLAALPPSRGRAVDLAVRLSVEAPRPEVLAAILSATPLFFHGRTRAFAYAGATVLTDELSWIRVERSGAEIAARIDPRSLEDGYSFSHTSLFIALMIALRSHGMFHLHAGAVVRSSGETVLLAGQGGAGKTTATLSLVATGAAYLGDDTVLLGEREGAPVLLQVPKPFHVDERSLGPFESLKPLVGSAYRENNGKRSLDLAGAYPGRSRAAAPAPDVILFPEVTHRAETVLEPVSSAEAMGALTEHSALIMVDGAVNVGPQLEIMRSIVSAARTYRALLGRDLLEDHRVLDRAL